jgi:nitroreductase
MDFFDVVQTRESVRAYDSTRPIPEEVLSRVLDAGRMAPSAANKQPWKIQVVQSEEMLAKVRECYGQSWFAASPCVLAVTGDLNAAWVRRYDGYNSLETDLTILMDHLILSATAEGLGTCWIAAFNPAVLRAALDLGPSEKVYAITPLGYPPDGYTRKGGKLRKELADIVRYL